MRGALLALVVVAIACARPRSDQAAVESVAIASDSIVGQVTEVGSDPGTWLSLQPQGGGASRRLTGERASRLRAVLGADVWIRGASESGAFRVDDLEVRRVNDQEVDDGIVIVTADRVEIRTRSGMQRSVPNAPPALRQLAGARVWISRPVAGVAPSYGVIEPP